ncbi:MAG: VWA domain-containing protein, partial [Bdellovibrionales bacterium]|nr:VWA domain-containing protein [Bdellovibrionales bacterium]
MRGKPDSGVFCRVRCFRHVGPALLCAIFLLCSFDMRADAEEIESPSAASHNIDTVLLLDSSGSMRRTDPGRLRDQGVEFILQFLKTGDRLAIIEFADAPHVVRDLVVYDSSQLENVRKEVSSITNSGIYTDLFLGLEKARDVFQANANELNERVVVVISDGQMDPDPGVSTPFDRVQQLDQSILPSLKSLGVKIHTLALGDAADRKLLSRISAETDGLAVFAQSAEAIQKSLAELFISVKKPQVITMETRGFPIDKGVEEATFYINRQEPGDIVLLDPDERPLTYEDHPENMNWYKSEQFDVITVERPADGYWTAQGLTSPENFATVLTNLRLMADFPSGNINSGDEVLLQARFFESRKPVSLPEFTGVVSYTYSVTPTDKISEPTHKGELHDDGEHGDIIPKDGVFSSLIRIDETGEYKLTVTARGPTFLRQQQVPFRV